MACPNPYNNTFTVMDFTSLLLRQAAINIEYIQACIQPIAVSYWLGWLLLE